MKAIEHPKEPGSADLNPHIRDFWTRNVNAERIMGRAVTEPPRGSEAYYQDLAEQRYRSHRHLLPWIAAMTPGHTVLEIGSGIGLDSFEMGKRGLDITSVDYTEVALHTFSKRLRGAGAPVRLAVADACRLPFGAAVFDYVFSFGVLHHVADTEQSLHEVYRVLKPGGEARIMLYHRRSLNELVHRLTGIPFEDKDESCPVVRRYTRAEARELFTAFSGVDITTVHLFGEGYGALYRYFPRPLFNFLSTLWGWHLMIVATK